MRVLALALLLTGCVTTPPLDHTGHDMAVAPNAAAPIVTIDRADLRMLERDYQEIARALAVDARAGKFDKATRQRIAYFDELLLVQINTASFAADADAGQAYASAVEALRRSLEIFDSYRSKP